MTTQENNKVSNFSEISTYKYDRFNEMVLSQLEQIIINFTNLPRVQALIQFYDTVDKHIFHEPKAHGFSINPYKSELINQLYQVYLNFGYTGDVKQMLFSFIKNIEIATHEDINYGWDKTKALPLSGWNTLFKKHDENPKAHQELYDLFNQYGVKCLEPYFYFNYCGLDNDVLFNQTDFIVDKWNQNRGTLYCEFKLNKNNLVNNALTLFRLKALDKEIKFEIQLIDEKLYLAFNSGSNLYLLKSPIETKGLDRFIITYDENMCEFRNLIDHKVITDFKFNNFNPFAMYGDLSISHSDTAIRELAYYPVVTKSNDQLFFLN